MEQETKGFFMTHLTTIIVAIIAAIPTIVCGWFIYNQSYKDKMTDIKIEQIKVENDTKFAINNRNIAYIHGTMWELLHKLEADRCFIIQPHPEHKHLFLSVCFEVDRKGVAPVKDFFQHIPVNTMPKFIKDMAANVWLYYDDIAKIDDPKAQSMMIMAGTKQLVLRQLVDVNSSWIGTLVIENIDIKGFDKEPAMETISTAATSIQYILPPIQ